MIQNRQKYQKFSKEERVLQIKNLSDVNILEKVPLFYSLKGYYQKQIKSIRFIILLSSETITFNFNYVSIMNNYVCNKKEVRS
ncbi:MAG: hypothetical protein JXR51_03590 [Bacteroidales bacterium]|nr:hypothetical protein [Bacteroidales bacterium]